MAGDQDCAEDWAEGMGCALLFSASPKPYGPVGQPVRLAAVERRRVPHTERTRPHAAAGLSGLLSALAEHKGGRLSYAVPLEDSDGVDAVTVLMEVGR